jgi:hypothetical protein
MILDADGLPMIESTIITPAITNAAAPWMIAAPMNRLAQTLSLSAIM